MAANVDIPKRRSLRLQDARVAAEDEAASTSSGAPGPAESRTSAVAKRLPAERSRVDTDGQEGSLGKRRSAEMQRRKQEPMTGETTTDQGPKETAPSTGGKEKSASMGPHTAKSASMGPNIAKGDTSLAPGSDHGRNIQTRRNQDRSSNNVVDNTRGAASFAATNTSFSRETRTSKAKNQEEPDASTVGGLGESAISSKEKKDKGCLDEEQGSEGPGGGSSSHNRSLRPRRSHDGAGESTVTTASLKRVTRSSGGKNHEGSGATTVGGLCEGAILSKETKDKACLDGSNFEKEQGSEGACGSSSHNRSLRLKRSRDGAREPTVTTASLKRVTRSSGGKSHEGSGDSTAIRDKGAISSKKKIEKVQLAKPNSQKREGYDDPGGSSSPNRSLLSSRSHEGLGFNAEDSPRGATSSTETNMSSSGKTRGSRAEEPAVSTPTRGNGDGVVPSKQKNENPNLAETKSRKVEGSEDPVGNSSPNRSLQARRSFNSTIVNVEDSPRGAASSTGTNTSFSRKTRFSNGKHHEEAGVSTVVGELDEGAVPSKGKKENAHLTEPNCQEGEGSEVSSINVKNSPRGLGSPTKSHDLISEEGRSSRQKDYEAAGVSTAAKRTDIDALLNKEESIIGPRNQSGEVIGLSGGGRSPGKILRPRRSHDGFGISSDHSEAIKGSDGTPSIGKKGKSEPIIQSGEVSGDTKGNISPRKITRTNMNLGDTVDDRPQPSNMTTESHAEETTRDYKVTCCSKQLLLEVLGMCTGIGKEILDSQRYLNEEQKQQYQKNFVWDFETAFQENVSINGLSWHEAPDKDSEPDIKILEDQLDEAMVETSVKRKRYPRKILSHFVKTLKTEREILNQYKPVVNPEKIVLDPAFESRMKDLSATAASISQHIHETKKALPAQLEKAEGFSQVLNLQPVLEASHLRKNIFYSHVVLEDISKSIPRALETTPTESKPKDLDTPVRSLRKRKIPSPQRRLYPLQSKRKISLDS